MPGQWKCQKGQCLLVPSGPGEFKHLFALLIDPVVVAGYGSQPRVLLAGLTSIKAGCTFDDACILKAGEHPFITHDSYVEYRFARWDTAEHIGDLVQSGVFSKKEPCSPDLLQKVVNGALRSRRISREFKCILEQVLFG